MKSLAFACLASIGIIGTSRAGADGRAIIAAMKLSEQPNYSWCATVEDDAGSYVIDGKTDTTGYTWIRRPMVTSLARQPGLPSDSALEAYFRGKTASVVRAGDQWTTLAELATAREDRSDRPKFPMVRGSANAGNFGIASPSLGAAAAFLTDRKHAGHGRSPAQLSVNHPHEELAIIVSCAQEMETKGDVVTGSLSETGAALLFVRDDQEDAPLAAAGVFKLWMRHGAVVKYQVRLEAVLAINRRKVVAHLTSNTVLNDVGSTRIAVPDEVRAKLEY